jgi:hypothetical protein
VTPNEMSKNECRSELAQIQEWQAALTEGLANQQAELKERDAVRIRLAEAARQPLVTAKRTTYAGVTQAIPDAADYDKASRLERDVRDAAALCSDMQARIRGSHELLGACSIRAAALSTRLNEPF